MVQVNKYWSCFHFSQFSELQNINEMAFYFFYDSLTHFCSNSINLIKTYGHITPQTVKNYVKNTENIKFANYKF